MSGLPTYRRVFVTARLFAMPRKPAGDGAAVLRAARPGRDA